MYAPSCISGLVRGSATCSRQAIDLHQTQLNGTGVWIDESGRTEQYSDTLAYRFATDLSDVVQRRRADWYVGQLAIQLLRGGIGMTNELNVDHHTPYSYRH
jgi:hypothetical protein